MIRQTHYAISKLLAAGLKRNQFSVRTYRNKKGEYDIKPVIALYMVTKDVLPLVKSLLDSGINVHYYYTTEDDYKQDKVFSIHVEENSTDTRGYKSITIFEPYYRSFFPDLE